MTETYRGVTIYTGYIPDEPGMYAYSNENPKFSVWADEFDEALNEAKRAIDSYLDRV